MACDPCIMAEKARALDQGEAWDMDRLAAYGKRLADRKKARALEASAQP